MMTTVNNLDQMLISEIEADIETLRKGIIYCEDQIMIANKTGETWAAKEFKAVKKDSQSKILKLSARLVNFYK